TLAGGVEFETGAAEGVSPGNVNGGKRLGVARLAEDKPFFPDAVANARQRLGPIADAKRNRAGRCRPAPRHMARAGQQQVSPWFEVSKVSVVQALGRLGLAQDV